MTRILGIESSCDETGVAIYDSNLGLIADTLYTQVAIHNQYGGVVPELASRDHLRKIIPLLDQCLAQAGCQLKDIDAIAYTAGPGLNGALLVGATIANSLAFANNLPTIPVHHLEGHLLSPLLSAQQPQAPFIALLASGGHSQIIAVEAIGCYHLLGDTVDDAAGEAFDKTAKMLGLPYPGGKYLAELAATGHESYALPRPMLHSADLTMSFSGLKTAAATLIKRLKAQNPILTGDHDPTHQGLTDQGLTGQVLADIANSIEAAITDVLCHKAIAALQQTGIKQLVVSGGVSANQTLRRKLDALGQQHGYQIYYPPLSLCTDNGAMIALAGYYRLINQKFSYDFNVFPRWELAHAN